MSNTVYEIELNAEAFKGAKVIKAYDTYEREVEGIFIPLDINGGYKKWNKGVMFYLKSFEVKQKNGIRTHIITTTLSAERIKSMINSGIVEEGENPSPIVGNFKIRDDLFRFKEQSKKRSIDEILGK